MELPVSIRGRTGYPPIINPPTEGKPSISLGVVSAVKSGEELLSHLT
jgi:hypothetical protein